MTFQIRRYGASWLPASHRDNHPYVEPAASSERIHRFPPPLLGAIVDFVITAFVIFMVTKAFLREKPKPAAAPTTKECPQCCERIPLAAKRCRACTSPV